MSKRPWSPNEEQQLATWRGQGVSNGEIARRLGRTRGSVTNKVKEPSVRASVDAHAPPPVDPIVEAQERRDRLRALREEKELQDAVADARSLWGRVDALFREIVPRVLPPRAYKAPPSMPKHKAIRETALIALSDWHYGEVVLSERVRGFNQYNSAIAVDAVRSVVANARTLLTYMRRGGYEFPRLVVAANGDLVTGTIHELEKYADGKTIVESVVECGELLAEVLRDLAADFPQVDVFCTVGNHGRLPDARRMEQKAPLRNWDALAYNIARVALSNVPNVRVHIPNSYSVGYDIMGHTFLQTHGHDIKSWNGIPWYGIRRHTSNIVALEASRQAYVRYFLLGHFHTATSLPHPGGEMFVNGSMIGATEYGVNSLGAADRPTQWLMGVHPKYGVTHRWPVYPDMDARTVSGAAA